MAARQAESRYAAARAADAAQASDTMLRRARATTARGELVDMPMLGRVWIELPGELVVDEIEAAVFEAMRKLGLELTAVNALTYGSRRTALTLAWSVRHPDPAKREERAGTEAEWCAIDIDMLSAMGAVYTDVRERLSPLSSPTLTADHLEAIRRGIEKKNPMLLQSVGVVALSSFLLSMVDQPSSSPTTPSSTGA